VCRNRGINYIYAKQNETEDECKKRRSTPRRRQDAARKQLVPSEMSEEQDILDRRKKGQR